jgi:general secretion pathway protein H
MTEIRTAHGQADISVIRFSSRGYTDKTVVHFRDDNGDELSVMISPFLSATRVLEGYVSLEDDRITLLR